jgi:hypothetical protein
LQKPSTKKTTKNPPNRNMNKRNKFKAMNKKKTPIKKLEQNERKKKKLEK